MIKKAFAISLAKTGFAAIEYTSDLEAKFKQMRGYGLDGAELAVKDPKEVDLAEIEKAIEKSGLVVPAIGTGEVYRIDGLSLSDLDTEKRKAAVERICQHIKLGKALDSLIILGSVKGQLPEGDEREKGRSYFDDSIQKCMDVAEQQGVTLVLEPLNRYESNFMNSVRAASEYIRKIGSKNLRVLADTFHMNIEDAILEGSLLDCGDVVKHVHIADSNRLYPGAGHIDFKGVYDALKKMNYSGFVSGEMIPKPSEKEAMIKFSNFFRSV